MAYNNGIDGKSLLDEISKVIDVAANQYREAGEDAGEEFAKGVIEGVKKHEKETKSEITKIFEDFNKTTNNFKSRKSVTNAEWTRVLGLSKELMKSERYADSVREKLSDISVTLKNGAKVSGLEKVLEEWSKVGGLVESVQWAEAGKNYRKKPSTKKPKVIDTTATKVDPAPVVKSEEKKQEAINDTTAAVLKQGEAIDNVAKQTVNMESAIKRYNKIVREVLARPDLEIGTDSSDTSIVGGWGLKEMVDEIKYWLGTYSDGASSSSLMKDESPEGRKAWMSETGKLKRFVAAYEPYVDIVKTTAAEVQKATNITEKQTNALREQEVVAEDAAKAQEKYNQRMSEIKDKYSGPISDKKALISNQEAWIKYLNGSLDESKFKTTGKKAATDQLRSLTHYMVNNRANNYQNAYGQYPKEMAEVAWMRGYQEAERQGVADSVLRRFDTDAKYNFDENLKKLQDHYDYRKKTMDDAYAELQRLYLERDKEAFSAFTDHLMPDGPQSDEESRILSEITEQLSNKVLGYGDAKANLEKSIMTLRNMASSEVKVNLQNLVDDLKKTYDTETFDKVFGADFGMFAGFDQIDDAGAKELYDMLVESNKAYQQSLNDASQALHEQKDIQEAINKLNALNTDPYDIKDENEVNRIYQERLAIIKQIGEERFKAYNEDEYEGALNVNREYEYRLTGFAEARDNDIYDELWERAFYDNEQIQSAQELEKLLEKRLGLLQKISLTDSDTYNEELEENKLIEDRIALMKKLEPLVASGAISKNDLEEIVFENGTLGERIDTLQALQMNSGKAFDETWDEALQDAQMFLDAYEKILVTTASGKKLELGPDMSMEDYRAFLRMDAEGTKSIEFIRKQTQALQEQEAAAESATDAQKKLNDATKDILYHAGDLSNPSKTQKTYPLGNVRPSKDGVVFNGFTGLYTTEDVDGFWGNEWSGAPISTIDASQYKLFDASSDAVASAVKVFFDNLNGTIYGYIDDFTIGAAKRLTDVKTVDELWADFNEIFKSANIGFEAFEAFVKRAQGLVFGKDFMEIYGLPDIDEGIVKTGEDNVLQGVSKEVFNSDSFQTQLLKMLGFEGIDLRGTKYNGTYTGGTVLFDVKPESIKTTNEKWSDVMARNGYAIHEVNLVHEEKRRQLAFDTAKAYSQQADAINTQSQIFEDEHGQLALFEGASSSAQKAIEDAHELEGSIKRIENLDGQMSFDEYVAESSKEQLKIEQQITAEKQKQNELVAIHGTSTENLIHALKEGAFPSPSIALTKPDVYSGGYGDATVVFKKSAIDPKNNPDNKIYGVDAYTPTYPSFGYELNERALIKASEQTGIAIDSLRYACDGAYENIEEAVKTLGVSAGIGDKLKEAFIKERGFVIGTTTIDEGVKNSLHVDDGNIHNVARDFIARDDVTFDSIVDDAIMRQEYLNALRQYVNTYNSQFEDFPQAKIKDYLVDNLEFRINASAMRGEMYEAEKEIFEHDQAVARGQRQTIDESTRFNEVQRIINENRSEYNDYVLQLLKSFMVQPNVRGANGQRFDKTPDGIAAAMATYGGKNALYNEDPFMRRSMDDQLFIIGAAKNYKSIEEAEADASRLQKDALGTHTKLDNGYIKGLARAVAETNKIEDQEAFDKIAQAVDGNTTAEAIGKALRDGGLNVDDEIVNKLAVAAQEAANVQTKYFEAKPQRALSTEDIAFVSLPNDSALAPDIKDMLASSGIPFVEHNSQDKDSREKALIEGMKQFDITGNATYDNLIANENKYQQELEETNRINKEREGQFDAYAQAAGMFLGDSKYDSVSFDDKNKLFESFGNKIMQDGMLASDAMDQLYLSMEKLVEQSKEMPDDIIEGFGAENEHVAETVSQLQKLSSIDLTRVFDSVDLKTFLEMFNIDKSHFATFRALFEELMQITKAMDSGTDVGNAFDVKMAEITDTIMRLGGHMVDLDDAGYSTVMQGFYKHMSDTKVQFNDTIKADYTKDQWQSLYKSSKRYLTADLTKGIAADSLYHELSGLFPSLFPEGVLSQQDQFKLIFDKLDEARQLQANNWKMIQGFVSSDRDDIQIGVDNIYNQMSDALFADSSATQLNADADALKEVEQSAKKAASAKGKFSQANKKLGEGAAESSDSLDDEAESLDAVNRAAANRPDTSDYDSVTTYMDEQGRPYTVSGTRTNMTDEASRRTTDQYVYDADNRRWDMVGTIQTDDRTARTREMVQALEEYYKIANRIQKLALDPSDAIHTGKINQLESDDLLRAYQRVADLGIDIYNIENQTNLTTKQRQALLDVERKARQDLYNIISETEDKQATLDVKPYQKTVRDERKKSSDIDTSIRLMGYDGVSSQLQGQVSEYRMLVNDLTRLGSQLDQNPNLANDVYFSNQFAETAKRAQNARVAIEGVFKESQKLQKIGNLVKVGDKDVSKVKNLKTAMIEFANNAFDGETKVQGFNKEGTEMYMTLNKGAGAVENITVALDKASGHLNAFNVGTSRATNEWEDFKTQAVAGAKNLVGMYVGFQEGVQAVRTGLNYVKEIDLAMTELKKVTDETDASYKQFLDDAGSTSAVIGSTISDFTEATATFARLGYSMEESSSMAETAIIYKNVAD